MHFYQNYNDAKADLIAGQHRRVHRWTVAVRRPVQGARPPSWP